MIPTKLILLENGSAVLTRDDERDILWSSDNDEEFKDQFQDEALGEDDVTDIFEYLVDKGHLKENEIEDVEVFDEGGDEDDEDYDIEEDDDEEFDGDDDEGELAQFDEE